MVNKAVHKALLAWYESNGRHELPWRNTENIYHIYVSEIMLQQTQVSRVRDEYYPKFLARFPTLEALGSAKLDDVFGLWSGLGYYSRARNLHKSAQLTGKKLPCEQKELLKLPGIGKYTASAICSFGYRQNVPVVDTNIARVFKRYFGLLEVKEKTLWEYATAFLNAADARAHNLALMDLGSLVCLPKNPACESCPLRLECVGRAEPELYTQKKKMQYETLDLFYGVHLKNGKIALKTSQEKLYKGMLVLPNVEPVEENFIAAFKHSYTKYRLNVNLYTLESVDDDVVWLEIKELENAPVSALTKKAAHFF